MSFPSWTQVEALRHLVSSLERELAHKTWANGVLADQVAHHRAEAARLRKELADRDKQDR